MAIYYIKLKRVWKGTQEDEALGITEMVRARGAGLQRETWGGLKGGRHHFLRDLPEQRCWFCTMKGLKSYGPALNNWWPPRALFFTFLLTHVPWWLWQLQITASSQADMQGSSGLSSAEPWASCQESRFRMDPHVARRVPSLCGGVCALLLCVLSHLSKMKPLRQRQLLRRFPPNPWASLPRPAGVGCRKCDPVCRFVLSRRATWPYLLLLLFWGLGDVFLPLRLSTARSSFTTPSKSARLKPVIQIDSIRRKVKTRSYEVFPNLFAYGLKSYKFCGPVF